MKLLNFNNIMICLWNWIISFQSSIDNDYLTRVEKVHGETIQLFQDRGRRVKLCSKTPQLITLFDLSEKDDKKGWYK